MSEEATSVTTQRQLPDAPATETAVESDSKAVGSTEVAATEKAKPVYSEADETFYDPKDLPEELKGHFKQMQRAFTKKMQGIKENRSKVQAYDQFQADPLGTIQRLAAQHGYQVTRAEAAAMQKQAQQPWEPKSWDDVITRVKSEAITEARESLLKELTPYLGEIKKVKQSQIERTLDEEVPEWRQYEPEMVEALQQHPTLANDPAALARMVIPDEVLKAKAMQDALKRMEKKTTAAKVSGGSNTSKTANTGKPERRLSFDEAVAFAKEKLARQGLRPH